MDFMRCLCIKDLFVVLVVLAARGEAVIPSLDGYQSCANTISSIKMATACSDIHASLTCITSLAMSTKSCKKGEGQNTTGEYCDVLSGQTTAPMAGESSRTDLNICREMAKLTKCLDKECGTGGNGFKPDPRRGEIPSKAGETCSMTAQMKCVKPVVNIKDWNKENCGKLNKAMDCFIADLGLCGGDREDQIAANVMVIGVQQNLKHCINDATNLKVSSLTITAIVGTLIYFIGSFGIMD